MLNEKVLRGLIFRILSVYSLIRSDNQMHDLISLVKFNLFLC